MRKTVDTRRLAYTRHTLVELSYQLTHSVPVG